MAAKLSIVLGLVVCVGCSAARAAAVAALPSLAPTASVAGDRALAARETLSDDGGDGDKITLEADVSLEAQDVDQSAASLRGFARQAAAKIISDEVLKDARIATFVLRLPPEKLESFLAQVMGLGDVTHRRIRAADVSKQYRDTEIQLDNLQRSLARYQEILKAATKVEEMLAVEEQLNRVRTAIERLTGELTFLADRVALATVTVSISPKDNTPMFAPHAKFYPGVKAAGLAYFRPDAGPVLFYGPGFSLQLARWLHFDVQVLRDRRDKVFAADVVDLSLGGEAYSDFLGRGKQTWFNPYFGFNAGWIRVEGVDFTSLGVMTGVEIYKSTYVVLDLGVKAAALANRFALHLAVEPTLSLDLAF
ncbi:MAG: DUF4349 domain-containing protein [Deltaproteobacteria bacterium]|nr:DUF4349 domain-containing protein [Deltaproteobacteria bacterium]